MNRFANTLRGLAPYLTVGDGGLEESLRLLHAIESAGAVAVELGVPFSDPIADGPRLQEAASRALAAGTNVAGILRMVERYRAENGALPLALMSYANPLQRKGWPDIVARVADHGIDALIVPDLPVDEATAMCEAAASRDVGTVFFVAPTSGTARIHQACAASTAFVYALGRVGVTGAATHFDPATTSYVQAVRKASEVPVALGFGLSTPRDVATALGIADIAIVGTAFVQHLHEARVAGRDTTIAAQEYIRTLLSLRASERSSS